VSDPIEELVHALDSEGKPSLAWVVKWSEAGGDPVAAAWTRSRNPSAMLLVLTLGRHPARAAAQRVWDAPIFFETSDVDRVRSDAIRTLVATPPTLEALIASSFYALRFDSMPPHPAGGAIAFCV
jgi:hypothetical protein